VLQLIVENLVFAWQRLFQVIVKVFGNEDSNYERREYNILILHHFDGHNHCPVGTDNVVVEDLF
jgi:hypothetical protein